MPSCHKRGSPLPLQKTQIRLEQNSGNNGLCWTFLAFFDGYPGKVMRGCFSTRFAGKDGRFKSGLSVGAAAAERGVGFHQHRTFTHSLARPATKRTNSPGLDIMRPRFTLILVISAEVKFTQPDTLDIAVLYPLNPYLHCKTWRQSHPPHYPTMTVGLCRFRFQKNRSSDSLIVFGFFSGIDSGIVSQKES